MSPIPPLLYPCCHSDKYLKQIRTMCQNGLSFDTTLPIKAVTRNEHEHTYMTTLGVMVGVIVFNATFINICSL